MRFPRSSFLFAVTIVAFARGLRADEFQAGHWFVACVADDSIVEFDEDGEFVRSITPEGLDQPREIVFGPNGRMYVSSFFSEEVLEILPNGTVSRRIPFSGMFGPRALSFGPRGHLFVSCFHFPKIREFDVLRSEIVERDGIGVPASEFSDMVFTTSGTIVAAQGNADSLWEFNPRGQVVRFELLPEVTTPSGIAIGPKQELWIGTNSNQGVMHTSAKLEPLASVPDPAFNGPGGMTIAPNGELFVCAVGSGRVVRFDTRTLEVLGTLGAGALDDKAPVGIAFAPTRFEARLELRIAKDGESLKSIDENVRIAITPGSRTITVQFKEGMTGDGLAAMLGQNGMTFHGSEVTDTGKKRLFDGSEVFDNSADGIGTIQLEVKGATTGDLAGYVVSKASGRIARVGSDVSYFGSIVTTSKID